MFSAKNVYSSVMPCASSPEIGTSVMSSWLASSAMAPAGYPPTKKNASMAPSRIRSAAWSGFRNCASTSSSESP